MDDGRSGQAAANVPAFVPAVAIRADGTYGVSYYDFRNNTADASTLLADYWLARSTDGITWLESHITGPFDLAVAPNSGGLFLGDYQALTSIGTVFLPFYAQTNTGNIANRTDVFSTLASSAGSANAAATDVAAVGCSSARDTAADHDAGAAADAAPERDAHDSAAHAGPRASGSSAGAVGSMRRTRRLCARLRVNIAL